MLTFICEDWLFELLIERAMTYSVGVTRQLRRVVNAINVSGRFEYASCLPKAVVRLAFVTLENMLRSSPYFSLSNRKSNAK